MQKISKLRKFGIGAVITFAFSFIFLLTLTGIFWGYNAFEAILMITIFGGGWLLMLFILLVGGFVFTSLTDAEYVHRTQKIWKQLFSYSIICFSILSVSELLHYWGWIDSRYQLNWYH